MAKFRFHRGSLAESLATEIEVSCLEDVEDAWNTDNPAPLPLGYLSCKFYSHDRRTKDYIDTYVVCYKGCIIGFSNAMLEYIKG